MSSSLRDSVCSTLQSFILNHENEFTAQDILRVFEREARLLQQGQQIKDMLRSDPFEHLENIRPKTMDRICKMISVQDHHVVLTKAGYSNIIGVVRLQADERMKTHGAVALYVELTFSYERQIAECSETGAASLLYFIELSRDDGPSEKLLWIEIFAHGATPSHFPPKNLISSDSDDDEHDGDDDDGWEDIDDDDDHDDEEADGKRPAEKPTAHKRKSDAMSSSESDELGGPANGSCTEKGGGGDSKDSCSKNHNVDKDENDESDRYRAGMDPDVLSRLLDWTQIGPLDDITAFFLLMTFPFYEHEFEIIGPFLDSVFGSDDDDDESNDMKEG